MNNVADLSLADLQARKETLLQDRDALIQGLDDTPSRARLLANNKVDLAKVDRLIADRQRHQYREIIKVAAADPAALEAKRNLAAVEVQDTASTMYLPFGRTLPNALLASGMISGQPRRILLRNDRVKAAVPYKAIPIHGRPHEHLIYNGPLMARDDRDVLRALMYFAAQAALGDNDPEVPAGYITVSARALMDEIGIRTPDTRYRRAIVASVLRWSLVQLALAKMLPGAKVEDALQIADFTHLIHLSGITKNPRTNAAEITYKVPRTAAKLFGYRDFSRLDSHHGYPPLVSFVLDYLAPHMSGYAIKVSDLHTASQSEATYANFVRKSLMDTLNWLTERGYVVDLREIDDVALSKILDADGEPVTGLQLRIAKPDALPAYDGKIEALKKRRGEWYRYMPRKRPGKRTSAATACVASATDL